MLINNNNLCRRTHFKTKISLRIGKVMKTRRKLNFTLVKND